jgi:hypothetical protein
MESHAYRVNWTKKHFLRKTIKGSVVFVIDNDSIIEVNEIVSQYLGPGISSYHVDDIGLAVIIQ